MKNSRVMSVNTQPGTTIYDASIKPSHDGSTKRVQPKNETSGVALWFFPSLFIYLAILDDSGLLK